MTLCHREFEMTACHREFEMTTCHREFEMTVCHRKFEMTVYHTEFVNDFANFRRCGYMNFQDNIKPQFLANLRRPRYVNF